MKWIVGIDEVGRGPIAGPVHVCAIAIPLLHYKKMRLKGVTDSKQMTPNAREKWHDSARELKREGKIKIGIARRGAKAIDERGINGCIRECIKSALQQLHLDPSECIVLLDGGLKAPREYIQQQTIIRGDKKHKIISLASVVAKVTRDRLMMKLHQSYPAFQWFENKGYGTRAHISAVLGNGLTPLHRKSFFTKVF